MDLEQGFKDALSSWASGVTVVTVRDARGLAYGLTVSSFSSVSLRPPLVSVCIADSNRLASMVADAGGFAVNILAWGQDDVSNWFASKGREPVEQLAIPSDDHASGHPLLRGVAAWVSCELAASHVEGDHVVLIGRVVDTFADPAVQPLLYYRRAYRTVTGDLPE